MTSPAFGPSMSMVSMVSGSPAFQATAARVCMVRSPGLMCACFGRLEFALAVGGKKRNRFGLVVARQRRVGGGIENLPEKIVCARIGRPAAFKLRQAAIREFGAGAQV